MPTPTDKMRAVRREVNQLFSYELDDGIIDDWEVHAATQKFSGDCEDYALTMLFVLSDRKWTKFWMNLITGKGRIMKVVTKSGEGHASLKYGGMYIDNTFPTWHNEDKVPHTIKFAWPFPLVAVKIVAGWFV